LARFVSTVPTAGRVSSARAGRAVTVGANSVIVFTRLNRAPVALNPDLIERVEVAPDTVITLVDGKKVLVSETMDEVVSRITRFRAEIIAMADMIELAEPIRPSLHLVAGDPAVTEGDD
jgi:flagellar protein FlbD